MVEPNYKFRPYFFAKELLVIPDIEFIQTFNEQFVHVLSPLRDDILFETTLSSSNKNDWVLSLGKKYILLVL
jgi:hypothetical protein